MCQSSSAWGFWSEGREETAEEKTCLEGGAFHVGAGLDQEGHAVGRAGHGGDVEEGAPFLRAGAGAGAGGSTCSL